MHSVSRAMEPCAWAGAGPRSCPFGGACHTCPARVQPKLRIGAPDDVYEREADRVADAVLRMSPLPQQHTPFARHEFGDDHSRRPALNRAHGGAQGPEPSGIVEKVVHSPGEPLPPAFRAFAEPRFGRSFADVRVHCSPCATRSADAINALAYTLGSHIVFAAHQYAPGTAAGNRLLAHELAHVVQQVGPPPAVEHGESLGITGAHAPLGACLQRRPRRRQPPFDFAGSPLAAAIRQGLESITIPYTDPPQPVVSPAAVIDTLARSARFLELARTLCNHYWPEAESTERPSPLRFAFHQSPDRGHFFDPATNTITIGVTTVDEIVPVLVHELLHAGHFTPVRVRTRGRGSVTISEEADVAEEVRTRTEENQIMAEINPAPTRRGRREREAAGRTYASAAQVRQDFVSWVPRITYQEFFIVNERQRSCLAQAGRRFAAPAAEVVADQARRTFPPLSEASTDAFQVGEPQRREYKAIAAQRYEPPPTYDQFVRLGTLFQRRRCNWDRIVSDPDLPPNTWFAYWCRRNLARLFCETRWRREDGNLTGEAAWDFTQLLQYYQHLYTGFRERQRIAQGFQAWYANPRTTEDERAAGLEFIEWRMIEFALAREWVGHDTADAATRRRHLEFLRRRIGRPLQGIRMPPEPNAARRRR